MRAEALVLEAQRLLIRDVQRSDWEALEPLLSDPRITRFMHISQWDTEEGRRAWFQWCLDNQEHRTGGNYNWVFVLRETEALVGWMVIGDSDRMERPGDRSLGYFVAPSFWNRGFMTEALRAVLRFEFEVLGVSRVTGNCEVDNVASARVMRSAGMMLVGTVRDADPLEGVVAERHHFALERGQYAASVGG